MPQHPDALRTRLADLGLNDREARLYLELLEAGEATASQLIVDCIHLPPASGPPIASNRPDWGGWMRPQL